MAEIPCNCNRAVLWFIPALLWVILLSELFILLTRVFIRFYSEMFYQQDFTQSPVWTAASPFISGLWMIFWAIITQSSSTEKSSFLAEIALIDVRNMFPSFSSSDSVSPVPKYTKVP